MPARLASALVLVLLLGACSPTPSTVPRPSASSSPSAPVSVAQARDAFFANHYTAAERLFRTHLGQQPNSVEGHAWFALLLNYEHRFPEADAEAQLARRLGPKDPLAAAVAIRVRDWSATTPAEIKPALQIGETASTFAARSSLFHAYYGEALSDSSLIPQATRELDLAAAGASTDYERAEVERNRANLSRDQHDNTTTLAHLKAAEAIQPHWVERVRELAEHYYGSDNLDLAVQKFHEAIALAPDDPQLRTTVGQVALLKEDIPVANEAFVAANQLKPHDAGIEEVLAVTDFGVHRDIPAAEKLLREAQADAPNNLDIADLLEGFLRYIKHDPAAADEVTLGSDVDPARPNSRQPPQLAAVKRAAAEAALRTVNDYRSKAHLSPVTLDDRISSGADSHAYWFLFNLGLPEVKGLGIHHEVAGSPGYTGFTMRDRASHFGYPNAPMAEDITHRGTAEAAVSDWVNSVFHRFPIMRPDLAALGFSNATLGVLPIEVMDMGYNNSAGDRRAIVPYPAPGQTDVPAAFFGNELPDPVPKGGAYPTGYPVTVNFNPYAHVVVTSSAITDAAGAPVDCYVLQPTPAGTENVLSMLPKAPFKASAVYHVQVSGTIDGSPFSQDYSFTTAGER